MATMDLNRVRIAVTAIGGDIVIARFGKDPALALDQRDANSEFWAAFLDFAFEHKTPEVGEGRELRFGSKTDSYVVTVRRVDGLTPLNTAKGEG